MERLLLGCVALLGQDKVGQNLQDRTECHECLKLQKVPTAGHVAVGQPPALGITFATVGPTSCSRARRASSCLDNSIVVAMAQDRRGATERATLTERSELAGQSKALSLQQKVRELKVVCALRSVGWVHRAVANTAHSACSRTHYALANQHCLTTSQSLKGSLTRQNRPTHTASQEGTLQVYNQRENRGKPGMQGRVVGSCRDARNIPGNPQGRWMRSRMQGEQGIGEASVTPRVARAKLRRDPHACADPSIDRNLLH